MINDPGKSFDDFFKAGQKALLAEQWKEAEKHFSNALKRAHQQSPEPKKGGGNSISIVDNQAAALLYLALSLYRQEKTGKAQRLILKAKKLQPSADLLSNLAHLEQKINQFLQYQKESKPIQREIKAFKAGVQAIEEEKWILAIKQFGHLFDEGMEGKKRQLVNQNLPLDQCYFFLALAHFKLDQVEAAARWVETFFSRTPESKLVPQMEEMRQTLTIRHKIRHQLDAIKHGEEALKRHEWTAARRHFQSVRLTPVQNTYKQYLDQILPPNLLLFYEVSAHWGEIMEIIKTHQDQSTVLDKKQIITLRRSLKECQANIKKAKESNLAPEILAQLKSMDKGCKEFLSRIK